jgi:hypothetical protein
MIIPASIRNRNPGAQYPGKSAKKFGGKNYETLISKDGKHLIATFPSDIQGAAAMFDLLSSSYCGMSVEKAITKWCGAFYVSTYIRVLEEKGGIKRTDMLTRDLLADPAKAIPLAKAMAWQEAGREYPMSDEQWMAAHRCCFVASVAPAFSPENDVPSPKAELRQAAAVATATKVAGVATATGGTVSAIALPKPPTAILDSAAAWKGFALQAMEFGAFAASSPKAIAVIVAAGAAMVFGPKLAPKLFGGGS